MEALNFQRKSADKAAEPAKKIRKREVASEQLVDHIQTVVGQKMAAVRSFIIGGDFNTNTDDFAGETTLAKLGQDGFQNCMEDFRLPFASLTPVDTVIPTRHLITSSPKARRLANRQLLADRMTLD